MLHHREACSVSPRRSPGPWCLSPPTTAVTSRERNCLWTAASPSGRRSTVAPPADRLPDRRPDERLQFLVEQYGSWAGAGGAELAEERGRPVGLQAGLPFPVLVDHHPQRGVQGRPDVVLRHPEGEQRVADNVLDRLPLPVGEAQQPPVVKRAEEHEAARPRHRLDPGPGSLGVSAGGDGSGHVRVEAPQLSLEGSGDLLERLVSRKANVVYREAVVIHSNFSRAMRPPSATTETLLTSGSICRRRRATSAAPGCECAGAARPTAGSAPSPGSQATSRCRQSHAGRPPLDDRPGPATCRRVS